MLIYDPLDRQVQEVDQPSNSSVDATTLTCLPRSPGAGHHHPVTSPRSVDELAAPLEQQNVAPDTVQLSEPLAAADESLFRQLTVPIRLIHDRWIDKYTEPRVSALAELKTTLEEESA